MEENFPIHDVSAGNNLVSVLENESGKRQSDLYGVRGTRERCLIIEQGCRYDRGQGERG